MRMHLAVLLGAGLALPAIAHAQPAPGWQQTLQGMFTGNQSQDQALRQAYDRGYQRGRDDEARALQANGYGDRDRDRRYGGDVGGPPPYSR